MNSNKSQDTKGMQRVALGPLESYISPLLENLKTKGYKKRTIGYYRKYLTVFSQWLYKNNFGIKDIDEKLIDEFYSVPHKKKYYKKSLICMLFFLRGHDELPSVSFGKMQEFILTPLVKEYKEYLLKERGVFPERYCNRYLKVAYDFTLGCIENENLQTYSISVRKVTAFLLNYLNGINPITAQLRGTTLRTFLRFLYLSERTKNNLAKVIPEISRKSYRGIPKFISYDKVQLLLERYDRSSLSGKRNYAILLLLARLGLRSGEIVAMTLDDIDWNTGELIIRGKGNQFDCLPLPTDVGEALAIYLREARPKCTCRQFFIRLCKPFVGFSASTAIHYIVKMAFRQTGIKLSRSGAHRLRHTLACRMLKHGATLSEIAEILRHRSLDTTRIYAKVDLLSLQDLCVPWPGGAK